MASTTTKNAAVTRIGTQIYIIECINSNDRTEFTFSSDIAMSVTYRMQVDAKYAVPSPILLLANTLGLWTVPLVVLATRVSRSFLDM